MPDGLDQTALLLGEIQGQLRELIHSINNVAQGQIALGARLTVLEADLARRQGATNVLAAIAKSPAIGWAVGIIAAAWAVLSGKVHP